MKASKPFHHLRERIVTDRSSVQIPAGFHTTGHSHHSGEGKHLPLRNNRCSGSDCSGNWQESTPKSKFTPGNITSVFTDKALTKHFFCCCFSTWLSKGVNHHNGCWSDQVAMDTLERLPSPLVYAPQLLMLPVRDPQPVFKDCQVKRSSWANSNRGIELTYQVRTTPVGHDEARTLHIKTGGTFVFHPTLLKTYQLLILLNSTFISARKTIWRFK